MHKVRRLYLTLLELMLVLGILALVAGFFGIQIHRAVTEQRFRSEVEQLVSHLRLAQNLMLIFRSNVQVKFWSEPDTAIYYQLQLDTPLPAGWSQDIQRIHQLKTLRVINPYEPVVEGKASTLGSLDSLFDDKDNELTLQFLSGGSVMNRLVLRLSTSEQADGPQAMTRWILLKGYPAPILSYAEDPGDKPFEEDLHFDRLLTRHTIEELRGPNH